MSRPILMIAVTDTVLSVKNGPCKVKALSIFNAAAAAGFVQFFNARLPADVTLGTTVPDWSLGANTLVTHNLDDLEVLFPLGLQIAATTTAGGLTAGTAAVQVNIALDD